MGFVIKQKVLDDFAELLEAHGVGLDEVKTTLKELEVIPARSVDMFMVQKPLSRTTVDKIIGFFNHPLKHSKTKPTTEYEIANLESERESLGLQVHYSDSKFEVESIFKYFHSDSLIYLEDDFAYENHSLRKDDFLFIDEFLKEFTYIFSRLSHVNFTIEHIKVPVIPGGAISSYKDDLVSLHQETDLIQRYTVKFKSLKDKLNQHHEVINKLKDVNNLRDIYYLSQLSGIDIEDYKRDSLRRLLKKSINLFRRELIRLIPEEDLKKRYQIKYCLKNVEGILEGFHQLSELASEKKKLDSLINKIETLKNLKKNTDTLQVVDQLLKDYKLNIKEHFEDTSSTDYILGGTQALSESEPDNPQAISAAQTRILDNYYREVLTQARSSFRLAVIFASIGSIGLAISIYFASSEKLRDKAFIPLVSGVVIEVFAGVILVLYDRTTQQLSSFHNKLNETNRFLLANSFCESMTSDVRDATRADLVKMVVIDSSEKVDKNKA